MKTRHDATGSGAVAKAIRASQRPRKREKRPIWGPLEVSTGPGTSPAKGGISEGSAPLKGQEQTVVGDVPEGRSSAHQREWLIGCLKLVRKREIEVKVLRGQCEVQGI